MDATVGSGGDTSDEFRVGQEVLITSGPFGAFSGIIEKIDWECRKLRVRVSFFGRETLVEVDFSQAGDAKGRG